MVIEKVLLVEEEEIGCKLATQLLAEKQSEVFCSRSGVSAIELLKEQSFDLLLCSMKLPDLCGLDVLKIAKNLQPSLSIVFFASPSQLDKAIESLRLGAFHYLIKPFSRETLEALFEKVQEHVALLQENQFLRREISSSEQGKKNQIIAESSVMKQILSDVAKIAKSNASVFISGESGTGKEVIAHAIHFQSLRAHGPFVKVNCAAIPESLIESEFFGHEKGSFTGAINKRIGRFELAHKGTLLLDEISEIPLTLQPKLLRAVQEQEFERVGGTKPIHVDIRFIATSNRNMKEAVDQKIFREDLYYRLNVVPITLSPLRERKEDILPLAEYFLERFCLENHKARKRLATDARKKLLKYPWPGNIRELANVIERTIVMNTAELIEPAHLCLDASSPKEIEPATASGLTLGEVEKRHILQTLAAQQNNRTKAAKALGISIRTLRNKLHSFAKEL